jgi:hypothetical protein
MFKLSDNYYQRKCYFKQEQVPTQSVMLKKMSPPLAKVYFKSMRPKLKVLAGLEPPMKGGGSDWFVPPSEFLKGRAVLKPVAKEALKKLGFNGIDFFGEDIVAHHHKCMQEEQRKALLENDLTWKATIEASCQQKWEDASREAAERNTHKVCDAFNEFSILYTTSITQIEILLQDASLNEIKRAKEEAYQNMLRRFELLVKKQATMLYDLYIDKLNNEKARLKDQFLDNLERARSSTFRELHDINVEKHTAIEKLRHYMECQNLACRVYVALKEREECEREILLSKHKHEKKVKLLKEEIALKDFEISLAKEKEKKRQEFNRVWQKKICEVVKRLQMFVSYCLNSLPEQSEFFLNMEKLMLLQLNEAVDNPSAESILVHEKDTFHTPIPRPHPYFLFCDKGYKPEIDQNLCPQHCTSSASHLPVIVVNKRCIYAACNNFEMFSDKIKQYVQGKRGDDADFEDDQDYAKYVPVTVTPSEQIGELKLESSLLQVLQKEYPNIKEVETECCVCRVPHCFCSRLLAKKISSPVLPPKKEVSIHSIPSGNKIERRDVELEHEKEPKWESYMDYVDPTKCRCAKTAKKHLREHLPAYMRNMSIYESPELPHYEPCSVATLQKLVRKAQRKRPPPEPMVVKSRTRDVCTQYSEPEFDVLCTCMSDDEVNRLYNDLFKEPRPDGFDIVGGSAAANNLERRSSSFATERAYSLRNLLASSPELEEIFRKADCNF